VQAKLCVLSMFLGQNEKLHIYAVVVITEYHKLHIYAVVGMKEYHGTLCDVGGVDG
jgi:hypothetical protein